MSLFICTSVLPVSNRGRHQDGKTLIPVLTRVHSDVAHTGWLATIKRGLGRNS